MLSNKDTTHKLMLSFNTTIVDLEEAIEARTMNLIGAKSKNRRETLMRVRPTVRDKCPPSKSLHMIFIILT